MLLTISSIINSLAIFYFNYVHFQFVASPKCQYVLDEIVYCGWPNWQDRGIVRKALWVLVQFVLVAVTCIVYIPVRLVRQCNCSKLKDVCCCSFGGLCSCSKFKDVCYWTSMNLYEFPYSKFINHTMSYVLFLCLLFVSSFQEEFGTTKTGLAWIGKFLL